MYADQKVRLRHSASSVLTFADEDWRLWIPNAVATDIAKLKQYRHSLRRKVLKKYKHMPIRACTLANDGGPDSLSNSDFALSEQA